MCAYVSVMSVTRVVWGTCVWGTWLLHMKTWLIHMRDVTWLTCHVCIRLSHVCHICGTCIWHVYICNVCICLSHVCGVRDMGMTDMTPSYGRHDSFMWGEWLIHMRDMTHSCERHISCIWRTWLLHLWDTQMRDTQMRDTQMRDTQILHLRDTPSFESRPWYEWVVWNDSFI